MENYNLKIKNDLYFNLKSEKYCCDEKFERSPDFIKSIYKSNTSSIVNHNNFQSDTVSVRSVYGSRVELLSSRRLDLWDIEYKKYIDNKAELFDSFSIIDRYSFERMASQLNIDEVFKERIFEFYEEAQDEEESLLLKSRSLLSLLRFYPVLKSYSSYELDFYLDPAGLLGAAFRRADITLNLLFKENDEVVFSSYDSERAMVRIIGSSMFSALLPNSRKIKRILRFLED